MVNLRKLKTTTDYNLGDVMIPFVWDRLRFDQKRIQDTQSEKIFNQLMLNLLRRERLIKKAT